MVATTLLHSKANLFDKHPTAEANLKELKDLGCTIMYNINVHTMSRHRSLKQMEFDRIVYNFPHAGYKYQREHDKAQIKLHQELLEGFFKSARDMITKNGEVHVTHKTAYPFDEWKVKDLAIKAGLCLVEEVAFSKDDYPGYENKRGDGKRCNKTFPVGECSTYKFGLPKLF
ncbi:hypothetical protein GIB67_035109 [Kingdonia uniflora]|uniref:25S rRNA (uridine-N(3))-methyltransferase BMT5-like domain-containing protein n=1 Tax=Kingdonia uniflora TaxID=39325 RepID=A0A7J7NC98_9MAGN|nr:hypothetical protein GIB67_035109 [Kingdonia uniflora]